MISLIFFILFTSMAAGLVTYGMARWSTTATIGGHCNRERLLPSEIFSRVRRRRVFWFWGALFAVIFVIGLMAFLRNMYGTSIPEESFFGTLAYRPISDLREWTQDDEISESLLYGIASGVWLLLMCALAVFGAFFGIRHACGGFFLTKGFYNLNLRRKAA